MGERRGEAVEDNQRQFFAAEFMGVNWFANGFVEDFCENYTGIIMIREVMMLEIVEFRQKKKKSSSCVTVEGWRTATKWTLRWDCFAVNSVDENQWRKKMGIWSTFSGLLPKLHLLMKITCYNQKLWNRTANKLSVKWNNLVECLKHLKIQKSSVFKFTSLI